MSQYSAPSFFSSSFFSAFTAHDEREHRLKAKVGCEISARPWDLLKLRKRRLFGSWNSLFFEQR